MTTTTGRTALNRPRLTGARWAGWIVGLLALTTAIAMLALLLGVTPISPVRALTPDTLDQTILLGIRLPRVLLGLMVGGALGAAGAALQAILRNPLADPFVLGVSGGAALGATFAIVAGAMLTMSIGPLEISGQADGLAGAVPISIAAAIGALCSTFLMLFVARSSGRLEPHSMLLAGVVFNAFAAALILFLRTLVTPDQAHALLPWLVGNLGHRSWSYLATGAVLVGAGTCFLILRSSRLNLLSVGEESAATLGVDVERTRLELIVVVSMIVGATVSLAGLVGFVGLVVPHMLRLVIGPDHRLLILASALGGASFLVGCDLLSRLAFLSVGTELPVGVVTAMIGAPLFLVLLRRSDRKRH